MEQVKEFTGIKMGLKAVLIGSRALRFDDKTLQSDWDIITPPDQALQLLSNRSELFIPPLSDEVDFCCSFHDSDNKFDLVIPRTSESANSLILDFMQQLPNKTTVTIPHIELECFLAPIELLIEIKKAHLYYSISWTRHIYRYHELLTIQKQLPNSLLIPEEIKNALLCDSQLLHGILPEDWSKASIRIDVLFAHKPVSQQWLDRLGDLHLHPDQIITKEEFLEEFSQKQRVCLISVGASSYSELGLTPLMALEYFVVSRFAKWLSDFIIENFVEIREIFETSSDMGSTWENPEVEDIQEDSFPIVQRFHTIIPNDFFLQMFSYFSLDQIVPLRLVCKAWSETIQSSEFWKYLYLIRWGFFGICLGEAFLNWRKMFDDRCKIISQSQIVSINHPLSEVVSSNLCSEMTEFIRNLPYDFIAIRWNEYLKASQCEHYAGYSTSDLIKRFPRELREILRMIYVVESFERNGQGPPIIGWKFIAFGLPSPDKNMSFEIQTQRGIQESSRYDQEILQLTLISNNKRIHSFNSLNFAGLCWGSFVNQISNDELSLLSVENFHSVFKSFPIGLVSVLCSVFVSATLRSEIRDHLINVLHSREKAKQNTLP
jgi:hypothetical protein